MWEAIAAIVGLLVVWLKVRAKGREKANRERLSEAIERAIDARNKQQGTAREVSDYLRRQRVARFLRQARRTSNPRK